MDLLCLVLERVEGSRRLARWLIVEGRGKGLWTRHFGVYCLANTERTQDFVKQVHKVEPTTTTIRYYIAREVEAAEVETILWSL